MCMYVHINIEKPVGAFLFVEYKDISTEGIDLERIT